MIGEFGYQNVNQNFAHRRLSIIDLSENAKRPMVYNLFM